MGCSAITDGHDFDRPQFEKMMIHKRAYRLNRGQRPVLLAETTYETGNYLGEFSFPGRSQIAVNDGFDTTAQRGADAIWFR